MVAMFWSPQAVLNAYPELQQAIEDGSEATLRATALPAEKICYNICKELERIQPDFFEQLGAMESNSRRYVRQDLGVGQSGAKAEDNNKVKHSIVHWQEWFSPLSKQAKNHLGPIPPGMCLPTCTNYSGL
ncbi:hypothetical protein RHS03_07854, partial [Rhizoctonia solani]